jgi:fucose permease
MAARFFGAMILRKVNSKKFLFYSVLFSLIGFAGVVVAPSLLIANICVVIIGLGTANVFPLIFAAAVEKLPERSNEISGLMIMSVCGGAIFPFLMGVTADALGAVASVAVLGVCVLYVLYVSSFILRKR